MSCQNKQNLEMNFRRGDSLHDHICGLPVVILPERSMRHFEDFKKISKLGKDLHQAKKSDKKKRLRLAILRCRLELSLIDLRSQREWFTTTLSGPSTLRRVVLCPWLWRRIVQILR
jgi:hypothetical protein